jgi:glycosyltransferase involved in cell wall biosynthesis
LKIIGDGPQMPDLRRLSQDLKIDTSVEFCGWLEHRQVQSHLADADVFAFPSIREFGGAVALEAMAVGVPPIVVDYGGPAELVTPQTGFLVPMGNRSEIVERLRNLLARLIADPSQIDARSEAALRRAREQFTWDAKAQQVLKVYEWILGRADKPNFPMPTPDLPASPQPENFHESHFPALSPAPVLT